MGLVFAQGDFHLTFVFTLAGLVFFASTKWRREPVAVTTLTVAVQWSEVGNWSYREAKTKFRDERYVQVTTLLLQVDEARPGARSEPRDHSAVAREVTTRGLSALSLDPRPPRG